MATTEHYVRHHVDHTEGLYLDTWSPGDGVTRYRFFVRPGNSYHGPDDSVFTALGASDAMTFVVGWKNGVAAAIRRERSCTK